MVIHQYFRQWSFVQKGQRISDLKWHICSITEDSAPWEWIKWYLISVLHRLSPVCVCQIQWKGQAWPRGRGLAQMWNWQMNSMNRLPPLRGQTQIWGDFTLESSTTPKSMVCEFWIGALVSTLCPEVPLLTGGWWYYVSWGFHSWCLFMLTIGLE